MSLQIMADTLAVLQSEVSHTEDRIRHHRYEADQLEARLAMLHRATERLAEYYEREREYQAVTPSSPLSIPPTPIVPLTRGTP